MNILLENLPIILPFLVVQVAFGLIALVHVLRHTHYRFGNKVMWALIVLLVNLIGPIIYFVFGRGEDE